MNAREPTYSRAVLRRVVSTVSTVSSVRSVSSGVPVDALALRAGLRRCGIVVARHAAYLTRLDAVLGDGDHGDNLVIGFRAVDALLADLPIDTPPGVLLQAIGHRLVAAVGGASGPLYGTAFLESGAVAGDRLTLDAMTLAAMLRAASDGLARRGRCAVGDKTILDALRPAADAFSVAMAVSLEPGPEAVETSVEIAAQAAVPAAVQAAVRAAVQAAFQGMRSTRGLVARRGLALRLGDRSIGHLDPGAVSCALLLRALGGR